MRRLRERLLDAVGRLMFGGIEPLCQGEPPLMWTVERELLERELQNRERERR